MDGLHLDITLPLRTFRLELTLGVGRETVALAGRSGAGKSTVLRAVAGLTRPERGRIAVDGEVWLDSATGVDRPAEERSVGMLFQDYALFPHLTVAQNVGFGRSGGEDALLRRFGIAHLAAARPASLSGGERQRVALARALAREPGVLLLDEPTAALDAHTRVSVRSELHDLLASLHLPTLVVTHDFEEAAALATRIGILEEGRIVQLGTASELVEAPATPFVASFTGGNLLAGVGRPAASGLTEVVLDAGGLVYSTDVLHGHVGVVVQPWEISVARSAPTDSTLNHLTAPIASLTPAGNRVRARVGPLTAELTESSARRLGLAQGDVVVASFKATAARLVPLA